MTIQTYNRLECHFLWWSDGVFVVWMALNLHGHHVCKALLRRDHTETAHYLCSSDISFTKYVCMYTHLSKKYILSSYLCYIYLLSLFNSVWNSDTSLVPLIGGVAAASWICTRPIWDAKIKSQTLISKYIINDPHSNNSNPRKHARNILQNQGTKNDVKGASRESRFLHQSSTISIEVNMLDLDMLLCGEFMIIVCNLQDWCS